MPTLKQLIFKNKATIAMYITILIALWFVLLN